MAITFPRDLPYNPTERSPFLPVYQQSQAITGGASVNAAELGPMLWSCAFESMITRRDEFAAWDAWLLSMRGSLRMFKGRPPGRKFPLAHPKGFAGMLYSASQWSGLGNLSVIGAQRDTITVNQIANGLILAPGDWFSIPVGTKQHLHKVLEGGTSAGNAISLTVEPTIRPNATTGIAVRFDTPYCEMVLKGGDYKLTQNGRGGTVSFTGLQVLA